MAMGNVRLSEGVGVAQVVAPPFCQGADWKPRSSTKVPGTCGACGKDLVGRLHWFCRSLPGTDHIDGPATTCRDRYAQNHFWAEARNAAIRRDGGKCVRCGEKAEGQREVISRDGHLLRHAPVAAEVNHIDPRNGAGYGNGCHNHQDGLETLCHKCHVLTTTQQGRERRRAASPQYAMEVGAGLKPAPMELESAPDYLEGMYILATGDLDGEV